MNATDIHVVQLVPLSTHYPVLYTVDMLPVHEILQSLANRCFIFRVCKLLPESLRYWSCYLAVVDFRRP